MLQNIDNVNMPFMHWVGTVFALFLCLLPIWVVGLKLGVKLGDRGRTLRHFGCWLVEVVVLISPYLAHEFVIKSHWAVLCGPAFALALGTQLGATLREFNRFNKLDGSGLSFPSILLTWIICTVLILVDVERIFDGVERDARYLVQSIALTVVLLLNTVFAVLLLRSVKKASATTTGGNADADVQMA